MIRQSLTGYGTALVKTEAPDIKPSGSEVLLRVHGCGVCHSDLHLQDGYFDLGEGKQLDIRGGRNLAVHARTRNFGLDRGGGPRCRRPRPSALYAVYAWIGCGACSRCVAGAEHFCDRPRHLGITVDGGYSSHVIVPHPRYLIDVTGIALAIAGSYMCSGLTSYSAIRKAMRFLRPGGALMIIGLGGVGSWDSKSPRRSPTPRSSPPTSCPKSARQPSRAAPRRASIRRGDHARKAVLAECRPGRRGNRFRRVGTSLTFAQSIVGKGGAVSSSASWADASACRCRCSRCESSPSSAPMSGRSAKRAARRRSSAQGKVGAVPITERPLAEANAALDDLRSGRVVGRTVLRP